MAFSAIRAVLTLALLGFSAQAFGQKSVKGEYVIKLKSQPGLMSALPAFKTIFGAKQIRVVSNQDGIVWVKRNSKEKASDGITALLATDLVDIAEPNYIYEAVRAPNDERYGELWGLNNTGQTINRRAGRAGMDIGMEAAWNIETGSPRVVVAVVDTGVDYTNPELTPNMWTNERERTGTPGVDDDGNGFVDDIYGYDFANGDGDPKDDHAHGTHCAGTIGAKGNDGVGVAGINWTVKIMAVKFLTASGGGTLENAIRAINYATDNGAQILSNSWGGTGYSQILEDSVRRSATRGTLFVAAAGNSGTNNDLRPFYPAGFNVENVLSVAAISNTGDLASFSCYGVNTVHVAAPGVRILSTTLRGYEYFDGTSMAAPHASGVAALVLANEPQLTGVQLKERLIRTVKPIDHLRVRTVSGGMINAYNALTNTTLAARTKFPTEWSKVAPRLVDEPMRFRAFARGNVPQ